MTEGPEVLVIGAGIVGVSAALNLQRRGLRVTLADRRAPGEGASFGNAGILVPGAMVPVPVPGLMKKAPGMLLRGKGPLFLRWPYLPVMLPWLARYLASGTDRNVRRIAEALMPIIGDSLEEHLALARGTPAEARIRAQPYLFAYRDRAAFEADGYGWAIRRAQGVGWREYEGDAVSGLEPALGPGYRFVAALEASHGRVDGPGDYVKALAGSFVAAGGALVEAAFTDFAREGAKVTGVHFGDRAIRAEKILVAAGAWSARVLKPLGLRIPLESERGYHAELWEPEGGPAHCIMLSDSKTAVTPMTGRVRFAGLVEFGGLDAGPRRAPLRAVRAGAAAFPGMRWRRETEWLGHRPAPADSIPYIGAVPGYPNVYTAFGHHHVGLTGGARTGRLIADVITGATPNIDMTPYRVDR
ncbi:MAG: FAD-dependent oxidoreductase [Rhodospirillaceae bacterium]|nr:FAD-dependent oxidoreductase [Rhodospirillaceae bacterium]MYH39275.1 FAD-dependent oxidoreductase [Rhodospirillaceae bacterium]MYK14393.1 FAD-dependent oxidoreductase [Rhodospirillaceae bacterium]